MGICREEDLRTNFEVVSFSAISEVGFQISDPSRVYVVDSRLFGFCSLQSIGDLRLSFNV